jgi:2-aminoadipate transaminase
VATTAKAGWEQLFAARTRGDVGGGIEAVLALTALPDVISFAGGLPDPRTFPRARMAELMTELAEAGETTAFQYAPTRGLPGLRDALAARIESLQARRPEDAELLVTSGGMEAMELTGKAFVDAGDVVVVEAPTYMGAIMAFRSFEAEVAAVPMVEHGLEVDELERRLRKGLRPKVLYTIPDHQNPAGVTLAAERRAPLVELARKFGFLVLEDVAYRELGFDGDALPSLWSLAPDVVVQAGTTSKTFFPGVRLGWTIAPPDVTAQLALAKQNTDQCAAALGQRLFEEYVRRGWIEEQLAVSRELYRKKAQLLLDALDRHLPDAAHWTQPAGGFFTWLTVSGAPEARELARLAGDARVGVVPGPLFFPDGRGGDSLRLSFSQVDESLIDEGVARLARLLAD